VSDRGRRPWSLLALAALLFSACLGSLRVRRYGLATPGPFHEGRLRSDADPMFADFAYDKWFEVRDVFLPDWIFGSRRPTSPPSNDDLESPYYASYDSLIDCLRPGKERYLILFRSFVDSAAEGGSSESTFYVLVRLDDQGRPDPRKSIVAYHYPAEAGPNWPWFPRKIALTGDHLRIEAVTAPPASAPIWFEAQGRRDPHFRLADYFARRQEVDRQAGGPPLEHRCAAFDTRKP
jgi:hypothetical protein